MDVEVSYSIIKNATEIQVILIAGITCISSSWYLSPTKRSIPQSTSIFRGWRANAQYDLHPQHDSTVWNCHEYPATHLSRFLHPSKTAIFLEWFNEIHTNHLYIKILCRHLSVLPRGSPTVTSVLSSSLGEYIGLIMSLLFEVAFHHDDVGNSLIEISGVMFHSLTIVDIRENVHIILTGRRITLSEVAKWSRIMMDERIWREKVDKKKETVSSIIEHPVPYRFLVFPSCRFSHFSLFHIWDVLIVSAPR